ncbi:MAG: FKBP-type peptidyl-prolyl cis-trans isomerase [Pirellulales bacterium]
MILRWKLAIVVTLVAAPAFAQQRPPQRTAQAPPRGQAAAPGAAAPGTAAPGAAAGGALGTVKAKASYSFGMMIGSNLKKQGVDVDVNLFVQGLRDASAGGKLMLTEEQAGEAIAAFEKEVSAKKANESKQFLAQNKSRPGVTTTPTGLQYKVLKAGTGAKPAKNDAVTVIYRGMFINGDEFDTSAGKPFTIGVGDVIPGWQEALQLMPVGSKWMLFVPSELAYGELGQPPIGPNATLVFELELVDIAKAPAAGAAPAAKARPRAEPVR